MSPTTRLQTLKNALRRLLDEESPPEHLIQRAIGLARRAPQREVFRLRAAASEPSGAGLLCTSESGMQTFAVWIPRGGDANRGLATITIHDDHRAAFEGRPARVVVKAGEGMRVLAEGVIRDGKAMVEVDLADLDYTHRDAIYAEFGPFADA